MVLVDGLARPAVLMPNALRDTVYPAEPLRLGPGTCKIACLCALVSHLLLQEKLASHTPGEQVLKGDAPRVHPTHPAQNGLGGCPLGGLPTSCLMSLPVPFPLLLSPLLWTRWPQTAQVHSYSYKATRPKSRCQPGCLGRAHLLAFPACRDPLGSWSLLPSSAWRMPICPSSLLLASVPFPFLRTGGIVGHSQTSCPLQNQLMSGLCHTCSLNPTLQGRSGHGLGGL